MNDSIQRRSLILITVDCLRADHVGFVGYQRPTTPFLDSVAKKSVVVPTTIVAGAPTYYSFPALFASRFPLDLGRDVIGLAPGECTLATTLRNAGYATAAFCAGNPYLTHRFGYHHGFDLFRDFLEQVPATDQGAAENDHVGFATRLNRNLERLSHKSAHLGHLYDNLYFEYCQRLANPHPESLDTLRRYPSADILVKEATAWLASLGDKAFFLWLHFMDPHAPYYPVAEALQSMGYDSTASEARYLNSYWNRGDLTPSRFQRHREKVLELYDSGIRWVDTQLSCLADSLSHLGLWNDCVLCLTADHGEEFLDHGGRFHSPSRVTDELIRVPLLLRVPGQEAVPPGHSPFSHLHLAPTLLDILRIEAPGAFQGQSYWQHLRARQSWCEPAITECISAATNPFHRQDRLGSRILAVREQHFKLVWDLGNQQELLYNLEEDPNELHPLPAHQAKDSRRRLLLRARQHLLEAESRANHSLRCRALAHELALEWSPNAHRVSSWAATNGRSG